MGLVSKVLGKKKKKLQPDEKRHQVAFLNMSYLQLDLGHSQLRLQSRLKEITAM